VCRRYGYPDSHRRYITLMEHRCNDYFYYDYYSRYLHRDSY
jgi:hypothetical protein